MTIKEVLEHPWIQKYNKNFKIFDQRRKSKDFSQFETYTTVDTSPNDKTEIKLEKDK